MKSTFLSILALTAAVLLAAGCGGGAATAPAPGVPGASEPASLKALVVENDGQTDELGGHVFTLVETGEMAVSAPDGSLAFGPVPAGNVTLRLTSVNPLRVLAQHGGDGAGHGEGEHHGEGEEHGEGEHHGEEHEEGDHEHANHEEVHVGQVRERERIEIRIHLENGEMTCVRVSREQDGECEVEVAMERTEANDDPDMEGELELERSRHRQEFEVEVEHADVGRELELVVVDTDGSEESQGVRTVDATGEAEWELDTGDGGRLPFAVSDLDELEDFGVEVRDADTGVTLLTATVPEMPPPAGNGDGPQGGGGDEDDGDEDERWRARALLTAVEAGLEGYVEIRSRTDDGETRERFKMEAEGLAAGREVEFFIEDPAQAGTFLSLGTRTAHGFAGEAHLEICTDEGGALPGGVASVADLVGLVVEVRDADTGALLLQGTVPELVAD